jgi:G3E family GTPase
VLLVETNGTTDTLGLLEALASDSRTAGFQPLQVCLVDCERWQLAHWQQELEARQVQTASHVMFTRLDVVSRARSEEVKASLRLINQRALVTNSERLGRQLKRLSKHRRWFTTSTVPTSGPTPAVESSHGHGADHDHAALSHGFTSIELNLPGALSEQQVLAWLERLPDRVLRVKGLARLKGEPDVFGSFQRVGQVSELRRYPFSNRARLASRAILIGPNLDAASLVRLTERALQSKAPTQPRRVRRKPVATSHESR